MAYSVAVKSALILSVATIFTYVITPTVSAQDTQVSASVCNPSSSASFVVEQPLNDSVITDVPVTVSGIVDQVSQIEFFIDDQLDSVLAIPANGTVFSHEIAFLAGTHTLKLIAYSACGGVHPERTLVMTYQPASGVVESDSTKTMLVGEGVVIDTVSDETENTEPLSFFEKYITLPAQNIARHLDLYSPATNTQASETISNITRFILFTSGVGIAVASSSQIFIAGITQRLSYLKIPASLMGNGPVKIGMRAGGIILIIIVFLV